MVASTGFDGALTFRTERVLPHEPMVVFGAFEDAARLARWWGPTGFRSVFEVFEFRTGGRWTFVMHGPTGATYQNEAVFEQVVSPSRVVLRHTSPPHFTLTVTLVGRGGGTALSWTQRFDDAETAAAVRAIVEPANEQNLDRLAAVLEELTT